MAGRYERINAHDDDDPESPVNRNQATQQQAIPNSPPPSFHSRASSNERSRRGSRVDPTLADAFDSADDSDDDADDTQRLVRGGSDSASSQTGVPTPSSSSSSSHQPTPSSARPVAPPRQVTQLPHTAGGAAASAFRVYGSGIQSDGVFSNMSAKPERGQEEKDEQPPTYEQAAADSAPPYWETTILAPGLGGPDEVYIDGMPVGSFFSFIWNGMISMSFQLIGFLLTYLLHSTHAAKNGSRAGLGITMIQYGFYMKGSDNNPPGAGGAGGAGGMGSGGAAAEGYATPPDPNAHDFDPNAVSTNGNGGGNGGGGGITDISGSDWIAYILMIVGWFILIRSISDYIRARQHERLVLQSPDRGLGIPIVAEGESPDRVV